MKQTFAAKLKEEREAAGLSQADLAHRAGLHTQAVAKLEQGIRDPAFATVQVLARVLGVSVAVFEDTTPSSGPGKAVAKPRGRPKKAPAAAVPHDEVQGEGEQPAAQRGPAAARGKKSQNKGKRR